MKRVTILLLSLATAATVTAGPIRALLFDSQAECNKLLIYLHANGKGQISLFKAQYPEWTALPERTGLAGYNATQWNSSTNCKHATSNLWAVPMNDKRIDRMISTHLFITNEFKLIWPTNGFQVIDSSFWNQPSQDLQP